MSKMAGTTQRMSMWECVWIVWVKKHVKADIWSLVKLAVQP
jgi:hypothetical protein